MHDTVEKFVGEKSFLIHFENVPGCGTGSNLNAKPAEHCFNDTIIGIHYLCDTLLVGLMPYLKLMATYNIVHVK